MDPDPYKLHERFQEHHRKQEQERLRLLQMNWYAQQSQSGHGTGARGWLARLASFIMTLAISGLAFTLLLGGIGFLVVGLVTGSEQTAVIGAAAGAVLGIVIALGASVRAATV